MNQAQYEYEVMRELWEFEQLNPPIFLEMREAEIARLDSMINQLKEKNGES